MEKLLGLPDLASVHGRHVDDFIIYVHYLMGVLFVGWLAYFFYALFRFHRNRNPKASYAGVQNHASSVIEILVVAVEAVLLVGLSIPLWAKFADDFPKDATQVRVVAEQFAWNGIYPGPDGVFGKQDFHLVSSTNAYGWDYTDAAVKDNFSGALNTIVVPNDKPVIAMITSKDVIHSFKVNSMRITQDAIPGMSIPIWFEPDKNICKTNMTFIINCAQLCGNSHSAMRGFLQVVTRADFDAFQSEKSKSAAAAAGGFE